MKFKDKIKPWVPLLDSVFFAMMTAFAYPLGITGLRTGRKATPPRDIYNIIDYSLESLLMFFTILYVIRLFGIELSWVGKIIFTKLRSKK